MWDGRAGATNVRADGNGHYGTLLLAISKEQSRSRHCR